MGRPAGTAKKKELFRDLTSKEMWGRLSVAMQNAGIIKAIGTDIELRRMLERKENDFNEKYPAVYTKDRDHFMYATRVYIVRHLLETDNNWVIRWVSNPKRLSPINIVKELFLKYGPQALPKHFKYAEKFGAVFRWDEEANVTIIMMLRGLGKSHNEVVCRSIFDYIRNPSEKCLIGHSEDDKAEDLLKRIRDALFHPNLMIAYPEFFADNPEIYRARGIEIRKDRINMKKLDFDDMYRIIDPTDYMRGESTWNLFTPRVDVTGKHFNRVKLDDFVTEKNSATVDGANKVTNIFYSLSGLEEYTLDENGKTIPMPISVTDTQYAIPNMITNVLDNRKCKAFIMPMTWDPDEHKTIYSYATEHQYQIDPIVDKKFIERKKEEFVTEQKFLAQCYMIGYNRDQMLAFAGERSEFIFAYADEEFAPTEVARIQLTKDDLIKRSVNIISKDPSYRDTGKDMDSAVSKDTQIAASYLDHYYYITDGVQQPGAPNQDQQIAPILKLDKGAKTDVLIIDSASYQFYVANGIFDKLKEVYWRNRKTVWYELYTKKNESKVLLASEVLGSMFSSGLIKVHWKLDWIIKEILRETLGYDSLDTLIQMCSLDKVRLEGMVLTKQYMSGQRNNLANSGKGGTIFRTTGY